jgi:hypothetical protein
MRRPPADQPERFPLEAPFNRASVGFVVPETDSLGSSVSAAALRRRRSQLATATATMTPPAATTAGQKMVWSNQNRRWTFATCIDARRTRATLSMSAFACLPAEGRRTHGP